VREALVETAMPDGFSISVISQRDRRGIHNSLLQVPELITPLRNDTQSILQKGYDNQTPGDSGYPRLDGLRVAVHQLLHFIGDSSNLDEHFVERSTVRRCSESGCSADRMSRSWTACPPSDRVWHICLHGCRTVPRRLVGVDVNPLSHGEMGYEWADEER
jgi:hypothetical protein